MRYRHFLRTPTPAESFGARYGASGDVREQRLTRVAAGIARQMSLDYDWRETLPGAVERWENPSIPSGFTYLAQFVAHDCTFASRPTGVIGAFGPPVENARSRLLSLETIYGLGPDHAPHAYVPQGNNTIGRPLLVTGAPSSQPRSSAACPFHELARAASGNTGEKPTVSGLSVALIADARNDAHPAIAQLTTLFQRLHNAVAGMIDAVASNVAPMNRDIHDYRIYYLARAICERNYRAIVRHDLLPRLLHPAVAALYRQPDRLPLDEQDVSTLPIEFAQAFRFGHAMVRPSYVFNDDNGYGEELVDMLLSNSAGRPWRMPLDRTWMVSWSHFFDDGRRPLNLSRRIGPSLAGGLFSREVFGSIDETASVGLVYRDLISAGAQPLWSVPALIAEMKSLRPALMARSPLLCDGTVRETALRAWLSAKRTASGLTAEDIEAIATDPPLLLYVLFEAAQDCGGQHLGVFGSLILGETLSRLLESAEHSSSADVHELARRLFGSSHVADEVERRIPDVNTMLGMIEALRSDIRSPMRQDALT